MMLLVMGDFHPAILRVVVGRRWCECVGIRYDMRIHESRVLVVCL